MTTERRTNARGHAQTRVTFTNAADDAPLEGVLHDVGRGGMFIVTPKPLPIGKRIDFEVHVEGAAAIAGMARVIWVRESAAGDLPAGMGLKFIDVDNDALLAIDRLVGLKKNVRERTVLGMAAPKPPEAKAPEPTVKKVRERTMLGIAPPPGPPREQELSWPEEPPEAPPEPVVAKAAEPEPEPVKEPEPEPEPVKEPEPEPVKEAEPEPVKEPEPEPVKLVAKEVAVAKEVEGPPPARELPKRESSSGRGWIVGVLLVVVLGVVAFVFRDQIMGAISPTTTPSASASASAAPPASSSAMPSALPTASAEPAIVDVVDAAADIAPTDASVTTSTLDAAMHDGGHDGGLHHKPDGGHHLHEHAPEHEHEHAHTAPTATHTAAGTDNPY